ncbi:MAG: anti-sigma factor antagonist [Chloroflexota bacterium]|nr:anti-sigma factor antagonist [Chloroflexota bacterium]
MDVRQLTIAGVLENVPRACDFVIGAARDAGLNEKAIYHCHLAVDETCTNVIEHGYALRRIDGVIEIVCSVEYNRFVITITDDSAAFDPLHISEPVHGLPAEGRTPGGWGITFIKRFMDEVSYRYADQRNHLVMKKIINAPHADSAPTFNQPLRISVASLTDKLRVLVLSGRLDSSTSRTLQTVLASELSVGNCRIVVDMAQVDYISSAGIKVLVSAWQRTRALDGDVILATLRPRVREVFEIIGLDSVFALVETPTHAIALTQMR